MLSRLRKKLGRTFMQQSFILSNYFNRDIFSKLFLFLLGLMLILPYQSLPIMTGAGTYLGVWNYIYIIMLFTLIGSLFLKPERKVNLNCVLYFCCFIVLVLISIVVGKINALPHYDLYAGLKIIFPLVLAVFVQISNIRISFKKLTRVILSCCFISAVLVLLDFFLGNVLRSHSFSISSMAAYVGAKRMYWSDNSLFLILLLLMIISHINKWINPRFLAVMLIIFSLDLFLCGNRTYVVALFLLLMLFLIFERRIGFMKLILGLLCISFVILLVYYFNSNFHFMINHRFLSIAPNTIDGRLSLYQVYLNNFQNHFIMGLGSPIFIQNGSVPVYTTDISLFSMFFYFGWCGVLMFLLSVIWIFKNIKESTLLDRISSKRIFKYFFYVSLIVSLNVDLFTRNIYVLVLFLLIAAIRYEDRLYVKIYHNKVEY